jgi:hypothetical protein
MTPCQMIKKDIFIRAIAQNEDLKWSGEITEDNIDAAYSKVLMEVDAHQDYESEFREGQVETGLDSHFSRNYEAKEVASQLSGGTWVGWTYWYGGGKYGEPEAIAWMEHAYFLDVTEVEKMVV